MSLLRDTIYTALVATSSPVWGYRMWRTGKWPIPEHLRLDNGPAMVAQRLRRWLDRLGTKTVYIPPVVRGRTATVNSLTANSGTSC